MEQITLPDYPLRTSTEDDITYVYDNSRDRYVKLTAEERVRQLFIQFLIRERGVPAGLVSVEQGIRHEGKQLRVDVLVHDRRGDPLLLVECKAPNEVISQRTFDQASDYNYILNAPYLVVTNGIDHYCCRIQTATGSVRFLDELPAYADLTGD